MFSSSATSSADPSGPESEDPAGVGHVLEVEEARVGEVETPVGAKREVVRLAQLEPVDLGDENLDLSVRSDALNAAWLHFFRTPCADNPAVLRDVERAVGAEAAGVRPAAGVCEDARACARLPDRDAARVGLDECDRAVVENGWALGEDQSVSQSFNIHAAHDTRLRLSAPRRKGGEAMGNDETISAEFPFDSHFVEVEGSKTPLHRRG